MPTISALTYTVTDTTVVATWTTDVVADSNLFAGGKAALDNGVAAISISHQAIVVGLIPHTIYACHVTSGGTSSVSQNVTTATSLIRTPITKVTFGSSTSIGNHGDDNPTFVSNDNKTYIAEDDGNGFVTGVPNVGANMQLGVLTTEATLVGTTVNLLTNYGGMSATNGTDGPGGNPLSNKQLGLFGISGNLFMFQSRSLPPNATGVNNPNYEEFYGNIMMSADHGATWNSWQNPAVFNANGVPPSPLGSFQFANGAIGCVSPIRYAVDDGTLGYNTPGNQIDGANAFVYCTYLNTVLVNNDALYLLRIPRIQMVLNNGTVGIQYWIGPASPSAADFVSDANWSSSVVSATVIYGNSHKVSFNDMVFVPTLNTYLLLNWYFPLDNVTNNSVWEICSAPTPAGPWTVATTKVNPVSGWYSPHPQHRTVASNLSLTDIAIQLIYSGDYHGGYATYYYPTYSTLTLNPSAGSPTMQQLVTDSFTRANENPLSGGGNWGTITSVGNLQIASNFCEAALINTNSCECWVGSGGVSADGNWANDQYAECTIATYTGAGPQSLGPGVRMSTSGTGYIIATNIGAINGGTLYRFAAGVFTAVTTSPATWGNTFNVGDVVRLQVVGTTFTIFQNGTSLATATDATLASGNPGLYVYDGTLLTNTQINSFAAGANQAATPTLSPAGGAVSSPQTVTITSASGGLIYYTTNGTTPTHASSSIASGGTISITPPKTVKAIASVADMADSIAASGTYTSSGGGGGGDLGPSYDFRIRI